MNFGHLAVFHAVAKEGNVSRAADRLLVSQPAVSKQLKELERSLGTALFDRLPKGMRLTAAGDLLAGYARRIFALEAEAELALDEMRGLRRGELTVGASTAIGMYILPDVFVRFRRAHPGIQIRLEIAASDVIQRRLLDGELQVGLTEGIVDADDIESTIIATERLVAIAHPRHPLASRRSISARALSAEPFVVRETGSGTKSLVERVMAERGLKVTAVMSLGSTEAIKRAVAGGVGIAIVSELAIGLELKARRLTKLRVTGLSITRPLYRLMVRNRSESAAFSPFMDMVTQAVKGAGLS